MIHCLDAPASSAAAGKHERERAVGGEQNSKSKNKERPDREARETRTFESTHKNSTNRSTFLGEMDSD